MNNKERCQDCICLIEKNKKWFCDEYQKECEKIKDCGEFKK